MLKKRIKKFIIISQVTASFPIFSIVNSEISFTVLLLNTMWKVSKYRVFPSSYFPVFGLNTGKYELEKTSVSGQFSRSEKVRWIYQNQLKIDSKRHVRWCNEVKLNQRDALDDTTETMLYISSEFVNSRRIYSSIHAWVKA